MRYDKKESEDREILDIPRYSAMQSGLGESKNGRWLSKDEVIEALDWCLNFGSEADCVSISRIEYLMEHLQDLS